MHLQRAGRNSARMSTSPRFLPPRKRDSTTPLRKDGHAKEMPFCKYGVMGRKWGDGRRMCKVAAFSTLALLRMFKLGRPRDTGPLARATYKCLLV